MAKMKIVHTLLKLDPRTGKCDFAGSAKEYQHLSADGSGWTCGNDYRTWETPELARAFAVAAGLPENTYEVVPRYARDEHGEFVIIPDEEKAK